MDCPGEGISSGKGGLSEAEDIPDSSLTAEGCLQTALPRGGQQVFCRPGDTHPSPSQDISAETEQGEEESYRSSRGEENSSTSKAEAGVSLMSSRNRGAV